MNSVSDDHTGEPAYIIMDPHHPVIGGPISVKVLGTSLLLAFAFSSCASLFFLLLLGLLYGIPVFMMLFCVFLILSLAALADYPDIPLILVTSKSQRPRFASALYRLFASTRVGFFSVFESVPALAANDVVSYLDAREKRQTAFLFMASEKAWARESSFIEQFIREIGHRFPAVRIGYLGTFTELDHIPDKICKVPFERIHGIKDLLWYLSEASIEANENGYVFYELFSQRYCILYFTPRSFRGIRWKGKIAKFYPFTAETAIRWIDALVDRYCLVDGNFSFVRSYVIFRLPHGDGIPLASSIIQEVRKRMEVRPRVFHVSSPLSRVRKNLPRIILGGACSQDVEVNMNVRKEE